MKQILIILLLATSCTGGQSNKDLKEEPTDSLQVSAKDSLNNGFGVENTSTDTTFIYRKVGKDFYHAIYIDKDKNSKRRQELTDFSFSEWDKETYHSSKSTIERKAPGNFKKHKTFSLPQNWLPLYKYKDKYYLYAPSDWGNAGRRIVNSQEFIYWFMEGPYPFPLLSFNKLSNRKYTLRMLNPFEDSVIPTQIIIHIIDPVTKMAVFEYADQEEEDYRYQLYIPVDNADSFDLVVNYCMEQKQMEFDFDKIDYAKMINSH